MYKRLLLIECAANPEELPQQLIFAFSWLRLSRTVIPLGCVAHFLSNCTKHCADTVLQ